MQSPGETMADATQVQGITQVAMTVSDVPAAVTFYKDAIGLPQLPIPAGPTMAFFMMGDVRLMISQPEAGFAPGGGTIIYMKVADIKGAVAGMKGRGVSFIRDEHLIAKLPDREVWLAEFKDPSGNHLCLMSEVKG
jgi:methylmalonyl-CoA/ethylmalonyl-CoA epimerase